MNSYLIRHRIRRAKNHRAPACNTVKANKLSKAQLHKASKTNKREVDANEQGSP